MQVARHSTTGEGHKAAGAHIMLRKEKGTGLHSQAVQAWRTASTTPLLWHSKGGARAGPRPSKRAAVDTP
jgi:hypothetical protein